MKPLEISFEVSVRKKYIKQARSTNENPPTKLSQIIWDWDV